MTMLFFVIVFSVLTVCTMKRSSFDNTVRLYDSFAEIREVYNGPIRFRQADWNNIKHESIILQTASENNNTTIFFERRIVRINVNMTERKDPIPFELIKQDNEYSIVRETETGHYFRIQSDLIEYSYEPQLDPIYEVSFYPLPINLSLIITYIVNSLRWNVRYTLQTFADGQTQFQILADIINSSPLIYYFNLTHLMAGDINLAFGNSKSSSLIATTISSKNNIDYSGIHLFSLINKSLTIEPYSILTLPILLANIQIKVCFTYNLILTIPLPITNSITSIISGKHKFQRLYQLSNSSSFLPTGQLLVYDSTLNVLTGECHLPTLAESEKYEFELGQDPDIMFVYNRTLTINRTTNSSLTTTNILIQNYKQRKVNVRFKSMCQLSMICLFYDSKARSLGSRLRYDLILEAKSEVAFTFTTVRLS
ncbi:unnamed protein product [Rotaria sp. Silwood2]|nr:unnamed protein product [Rotaria sp. Silwood2]CAF2605942.1 unnamed protein product [Rotaria sp. Silwood2]CAF3020000.1 unnamed protein product [Rotaria sp. Silwood2]CAF3931219.1 unnamed protein product [Rotaria sp. Silwood2]CAF4175589.1 unnamed protein product [Rotaria sp. Silwood2]